MGLSTARRLTCLLCFVLTAASATGQSTCYLRQTCGDADTSRRDCEAMRCCWDDAIASGPRCFTNQDENCAALKLRPPCANQPTLHHPTPAIKQNEEPEAFAVVGDNDGDSIWDASGEEGYDEVEMIVVVQSTEGQGYIGSTPASNVPAAQNVTDVDEGESGTLESTQPAEEAEDDRFLTSRISEHADGDEGESSPAAEEKVDSDSDSGSDKGSQRFEPPASQPVPARVTKKRLGSSDHHMQDTQLETDAGPSTPPSVEISMPETEEQIEEMAMESQVAPDMSEDIASDSEGAELEQTEVTTPVPGPSEPQAEMIPEPQVEHESELGQEAAGTPAPAPEQESQPPAAIAVESVKSESDGILFETSKRHAESDAKRETFFSGGEDEGDLEEPFIEISWAYGSVGAPASMVEFDLELEVFMAAASEISPEVSEDEKTIAASQTDIAESPAEAEAHASTEAIPAASPESESESVPDLWLEERVEIIGSQGFVTFVPVEREQERVESLVWASEDSSTEVFAQTEEQSTTDSASLLKSTPRESLETSIQDIPSSIAEDHTSEFIDTPNDFRTPDPEQSESSQETEHAPNVGLANGDEERPTTTERKAKAKHKSAHHLTNGSPQESSCATSNFIPCGNGRMTKDECRALGCCWLPLGRHFILQAVCYMPQSGIYTGNLDPRVSI